MRLCVVEGRALVTNLLPIEEYQFPNPIQTYINIILEDTFGICYLAEKNNKQTGSFIGATFSSLRSLAAGRELIKRDYLSCGATHHAIISLFLLIRRSAAIVVLIVAGRCRTCFTVVGS